MTHLIFNHPHEINSLLSDALDIIRNVPMFEYSNGSGKFHENYQTWQFHKSSNHPLITTFVAIFEGFKSELHSSFNKNFNIEFVNVAYTDDSSLPICISHKDGHFFDGQIHLPIIGNSNVIVENNNDKKIINVTNGNMWYLNGSHYFHSIVPSKGPRLEVLAPVNQLETHVTRKLNCISKCDLKYLDSSHPDWLRLRDEQTSYVKTAISRKTASNLEIASFNYLHDEKVKKFNQRFKL